MVSAGYSIIETIDHSPLTRSRKTPYAVIEQQYSSQYYYAFHGSRRDYYDSRLILNIGCNLIKRVHFIFKMRK